MKTGKKVQEIETKARGNGPANALVFTPHGKWVGLSTRGGVSLDLTFWDVDSGEKVGVVKGGTMRGAGFMGKSVMFTRNGTYLTAGGMFGELRLYARRPGLNEPLPFMVPRRPDDPLLDIVPKKKEKLPKR